MNDKPYWYCERWYTLGLRNGFTLIELILVILLVSILSAVAVLKWPDDSQLNLPKHASLLQSHLRHIQALAHHWGRSLRFSISANSYSVACVNASASAPCDVSPIIDPATNQSFSFFLPSGINLSGVATTDFDSLGRPVSAGSLITANPARSFTLTANSVSYTVNLSPISGHVSVSP